MFYKLIKNNEVVKIFCDIDVEYKINGDFYIGGKWISDKYFYIKLIYDSNKKEHKLDETKYELVNMTYDIKYELILIDAVVNSNIYNEILGNVKNYYKIINKNIITFDYIFQIKKN